MSMIKKMRSLRRYVTELYNVCSSEEKTEWIHVFEH